VVKGRLSCLEHCNMSSGILSSSMSRVLRRSFRFCVEF
jgi:hypothetical protein